MLNPRDLTLDINSLLDNIHNNTPFFYFAKNYNSNASLNLEDKEDFLINRLSNRDNYFSKYFIKAWQDNSPIYNKENINNYLDNRIEFIKLLGVALYLLAAAPIRGTEVEVIKYYNTIEYGERNLFIDNKTKLFRIETSYCKTNNITNKDNNIVRFLSPKLSSILKVYLLFIIPFYNFINITIFNNITINPYILEYKGKILSSSFISNYLGNLTEELLGNRITINSYRQFYKYLVKSRLPNYNIDLGLELEIEEENSNNIEDILFNYNTRTSLQNYAQEYSLFRNKNSSLEQRSIDFTTAIFNFIGLKSFNFNVNKDFFNYLELENIKDNPSSSKRARSNTTLSNIATIFTKKSKSNTIEYSSSSSSIEEEEEIENNTLINTSPTKRNRSTTISSLDTSKINKKQRIISISSSSSSSILEELDINKEKIIPNKAPKQVLLKNKRLSNKQPIQQIEEEEESTIDNLDLYSFPTPKKASRTIKRLKEKRSIIAINKPKGFIENKEKEYNYNSNSSSLEEEEEEINNNNNIATIDKSKQTKAINYIEELEEEPSNSYIQDYFNSIVEEDNNSIIESNNSIREDNNSIIEDNNSFIEKNNSIIEDNNSIIEDNSSIIEDNNIFTDIDNYSSFSKQIEQLDLTTINPSSSIFTSKLKNTLSFSPKKNSNLEYNSLIKATKEDNNSILSSSNNSIYSYKEIELFSSPLQSKQSKVKDTSIDISISLENRLEIVKERIKLRKLQNKEINTIKKPLVFYLNKLYKRINIDTNSFTTIKQEEAINAVINLEPFITYISKTGGGKSNLFFLPSFIYPFRAFIVVVPRVSLLQDLYSRSKDFKLNSTIFSIDNINITNYNLIFISLEDFNSREFINYTSNLKDIYSNITIFLEETHLLLLEEDFRNVLKDINKVVTLKLQLVFITATLPSLLQDLLELTFYLDSNLVIRESTTQDKIQYITIPFKGNSINSLKHFYKQELELASKEEKIIIYVNTKVEGLELAKILTINYYFSAKTKEEKESNSNKLIEFLDFNSNSKAIIATSALLVGIDYPKIRAVFFTNTPNSLVNSIQGVDRVARQLTKGKAYFFYNPSLTLPSIDFSIFTKDNTTIEDFKIVDNYKIIEFLLQKQCNRIPIEEFLDNNKIEFCNNNIIPCKCCSLRQKALVETSNKYKAKVLTITQIKEELLNKIRFIKEEFCMNCFLLRKHNNCFTYNYLACKEDNRRVEKRVASIFRVIKNNIIRQDRLGRDIKGIIPPTKIICFYCYLPQIICKSREKSSCLYKDIIVYFIILLQILIDREVDTKDFFKLEDLKVKYLINNSYTTQLDNIIIILLGKESSLFNLPTLEVYNLLIDFNFNKLQAILEDLDNSSSNLAFTSSFNTSRSISKNTSTSSLASKYYREEEEEDFNLESLFSSTSY